MNDHLHFASMPNLLSIIDIAVALPNHVENIEEAAQILELNSSDVRLFKRYFGLNTFHIDYENTLGALISSALSRIVERNQELIRDVSHLIYCHTLPSVLPFASDMVKLTTASCLPSEVEVLSLTMNHCATGVSAFSLIDSVLTNDDLALLVLGEKAFHPLVRLIPNTTIMGEAAAVVLVGRRAGIFEYNGSRTTHAIRHPIIPQLESAGPLHTFGDFYAEAVVRHLHDTVAHLGISFDCIKYIFPHNVNESSWRAISNNLKFTYEKVYTRNISRYGHCFGADPFISAIEAIDNGEVKNGDRVLLVSAGLGVTISAALFRATLKTEKVEEKEGLIVSKFVSYDECTQMVLASLESTGIDEQRIKALTGGADLFGEFGLLDSFSIVMLVASISETLEARLGSPVDLLSDGSMDIENSLCSLHSIASLVQAKLSSEN